MLRAAEPRRERYGWGKAEFSGAATGIRGRQDSVVARMGVMHRTDDVRQVGTQYKQTR